ncbi:MAG TPA: PAS domain S-box protein [Bacteroidetes bacterium]|nr:PAS domain S-box protein [Bacteroidota bacterium]
MLKIPRKLTILNQLKLLFDSKQIIVLVTDTQLILKDINSAFLDQLGYSHQEVLNTTLLDFLSDCDQKKWKALSENFNNKETDLGSLESSFISKNGSPITFRIDISPSYEEDASLSKIVLVGYNITKENKIKKELKTTETFFKTIYDQCPSGIVFSNKDGGLEANQKFCDMIGYSKEELRKMTAKDVTFPEDRFLHLDGQKKLDNKEFESYTFEKRYLSRTGKIIYAKVTLYKIHEEISNYGTQVALIEDISDKKGLNKKNLELQQLRLQESISKSEKEELQSKMDALNRELTSNLMFISQRNSLLNAINDSLVEISSKAGYEIKYELFKISAKVKNNIMLDEAWSKFKFHFDQIHPDFFSKLRKMNPSLTQKELKQCAYICIGLSNKEAAQLLSVSPKSIEMARYRIKKKFKLEPEDNLMAFIQSL